MQEEAVVAWKAPWWARVAAGAAGALYLLLAYRSPDNPPLWPRWAQLSFQGLSAALYLLAAATLVAYIARARITLTRDEVIVRNTLRTHRIALNDIEAAHGSFRGVEIRPTGARGVRAEAAPYSLSAHLHHARGRSGEIADAITASARASNDPPPLPDCATARTAS